jgi:hypothetical protein
MAQGYCSVYKVREIPAAEDSLVRVDPGHRGPGDPTRSSERGREMQ